MHISVEENNLKFCVCVYFYCAASRRDFLAHSWIGQWEGSVEVRAQLRAHKQLVSHPETQKFCEATRQNCVDNKAILKPCLQSLHVTPGFRLPHLEPLKREITLLAEKVGLSLGEHGAYKPAVELKKLLGFIKRRAARKEVTKERVSKHLVVYLFFGNA